MTAETFSPALQFVVTLMLLAYAAVVRKCSPTPSYHWTVKLSLVFHQLQTIPNLIRHHDCSYLAFVTFDAAVTLGSVVLRSFPRVLHHTAQQARCNRAFNNTSDIPGDNQQAAFFGAKCMI